MHTCDAIPLSQTRLPLTDDVLRLESACTCEASEAISQRVPGGGVLQCKARASLRYVTSASKRPLAYLDSACPIWKIRTITRQSCDHIRSQWAEEKEEFRRHSVRGGAPEFELPLFESTFLR